MILKLKRQARSDFRGRHSEATLIMQAVSWYLRSAFSYRDIEEMLLERVTAVDRSTLNRWVMSCPPSIERRVRRCGKPQCGSLHVDETDIRVQSHREPRRGHALKARS